MIRLRPYKPSDAWPLLRWWDGWPEEEFVKWSAGRFSYPLTIEQLDGYFEEWCLKREDGWPMTALGPDGKPVGHVLMWSADYEENTVRVGLIVTDPRRRGAGCGTQMMRLALQYAFETLGMERVALTVFENNPAARACYQAAGFREKTYLPEYWKEDGEAFGAYEMEARAENEGTR